MKFLFSDTRPLDCATREKFFLTEEIMMENAASGLEEGFFSFCDDLEIHTEFLKILVLCGSGNNGADGYAFARRMAGNFMEDCGIAVFQTDLPKSELCKIQAERAKKSGVNFYSGDFENLPLEIQNADIIVDCVFGSGFHGEFPQEINSLFEKINSLTSYKIACDLPSGLAEDGTCTKNIFRANLTVTMGALKASLYSDSAKDFTGKIIVKDLGISRVNFENSSSEVRPLAFLLEESDLRLPHRKSNLVNKGSFGHAVLACGEKPGASCIAASAALRFGSGLVSLVRLTEDFSKKELPQIPAEIMASTFFPKNASAVAVGPGLGRNDEILEPYFDWLKNHAEIPALIDADACYYKNLPNFLTEHGKNCVLTPHPKEFQSLLEICGLGTFSISDCVNKRLELIPLFCKKFPETVLLVKGANPVIGIYSEEKMTMCVNPLGTNCLAKAGSGDVLSGLICGLLAQGYKTFEAAVSGSLAHALASRKIKNDFSMTPFSLIEAVADL